MKKIIFTLLGIITLSYSNAQQLQSSVIGAAGNVTSTPTLTLDWTMGETFVGLMGSEDIIVSNGFHDQMDLSILSVEEHNYENGLIYFPNPVTDNMTITNVLSEGKVIVYDINGRLVLENRIFPNVENVLNLSFLSAGTYVANVITESKTNQFKIIKK